MALNKAELQVLLSLNDQASKKIRAALGTLDKQTHQTTNKFATLGRSLRRHWLGIAAAIGGVVVIGRGLAHVVNTAISFESAFAGVRKTVDATEEEFAQLNKGLREMSKTIPVAADDLAGIQEIAGQLGVRGVKELTKFTEVVAKISVTTNLTKQSAATSFARIANVMQEPLTNIDRMASSVVDLGNNYATTEAEITNFANRIAASANVVNMSTADIMGFGAAFSAVGVRAERGGTAVSKALIMIGAAVSNGGRQLKDFAEITGMTTDQFVTAFEEDAAGAFALFIEGLGKAGLKGARILKELELGDQRLIQAFLSVGGASGILTRAIEDSNKAFEENIALEEEAAKRFGTTASQVQLLKNNFDDLQREIGNKATPALNNYIEGLILTIKHTELLAKKTEALTMAMKLAADPAYVAKLLPKPGPVEPIMEPRTFDNMTPPVPDVTEHEAAYANLSEFMSGYFTKQEEKVQNMKDNWSAYSNSILSDRLTSIQTETEYHQLALDTQLRASQSMWVLVGKMRDKFTAGFAASFVNVVKGLQTAKEAATDFGWSLVQTLIDFAAQKAINFALSKAFQAAEVTAATITGGSVAAAWAPAAANVSLATLGANAGPATASMATVHAIAAALSAPKLGDGGIVTRPTLAMIGERGPEAVVPLDKGIGGMSINFENAFFREDQDVEELFSELSDLVEERRRARI